MTPSLQQHLMVDLSPALPSKLSATVPAVPGMTGSVSDFPFIVLTEPLPIKGELGGHLWGPGP